jgi:hypothetical protein
MSLMRAPESSIAADAGTGAVYSRYYLFCNTYDAHHIPDVALRARSVRNVTVTGVTVAPERQQRRLSPVQDGSKQIR